MILIKNKYCNFVKKMVQFICYKIGNLFLLKYKRIKGGQYE